MQASLIDNIVFGFLSTGLIAFASAAVIARDTQTSASNFIISACFLCAFLGVFSSGYIACIALISYASIAAAIIFMAIQIPKTKSLHRRKTLPIILVISFFVIIAKFQKNTHIHQNIDLETFNNPIGLSLLLVTIFLISLSSIKLIRK